MYSVKSLGHSGFIQASDVKSIVYEHKPNIDSQLKLVDFKTKDKNLSRYKISRKLSAVSHGRVFLCQKRGKHWVALKEVVCANLDEANSYMAECLKGLKLNHRNIIAFNDAFQVVDDREDIRRQVRDPAEFHIATVSAPRPEGP